MKDNREYKAVYIVTAEDRFHDVFGSIYDARLALIDLQAEGYHMSALNIIETTVGFYGED